METIWKYPIKITDHQDVSMPSGAVALTVQMQAGALTLWALVNPDAPTEPRRVRVIGTGHPCNVEAFDYVGSVQDRAFMWHVFIERD